LWQPAKLAHASDIIESMHEDGADTHELANGGPLFFESCNNLYMVRFEEVSVFSFHFVQYVTSKCYELYKAHVRKCYKRMLQLWI
jgi:hypothetical protein